MLNQLLHGLSDVIYNYVCAKCKNKLEWTYHPDADGSHYTAQCCGIKTSFYLTHGKIETEPVEEEQRVKLKDFPTESQIRHMQSAGLKWEMEEEK